MLGRFYFKAGQDAEKGAVLALNDSTATGTVSLDAVRIGGGTGFIGDATMAPLGRPRYEECARYHRSSTEHRPRCSRPRAPTRWPTSATTT